MTTLPGAMPTSSVAAAGLGQLGGYVESWYRSLPHAAKERVQARASVLGVRLPQDLRAAFGTDAAVAVAPPAIDGTPARYVLRTTSPDPVNGFRAVQAYSQQVVYPLTGTPWEADLTGTGIVAGTDAQIVADTASGGDLGSQEQFTTVLPETDDAAVLAWADLPALADALAGPLPTPFGTVELGPGTRRRLAGLATAGLWIRAATADGDTQARMRVDVGSSR